MKARVKATGETVDVMYSHTTNDKGYDIIWYITPRGACFSKRELEFIDTGESLDYWDKLLHQYAGMAMQGILSNQDYCKLLIDENNVGSFADDVSRCAKDFATALVKKLKEGVNEKTMH